MRRPPWRRTLAAIALATWVPAACSWGVDFDRFAREPLTGGDADADDEDAPADAPAEGTTGPFCASLNPKPSFCADFDEPPFLGDWASVVAIPPGEGGLDPTVARSEPNAYAARSRACDGGTCSTGVATIRRNFGSSTFRAWRLSFDIYLETNPLGTASSGPLAISVDYNNVYAVHLFLVPQGSFLEQKVMNADGATTNNVHDNFDFQSVGLRQWRHIDISRTAVDGGGTYTLLIDGTRAWVDGGVAIGGNLSAPTSMTLGFLGAAGNVDDWIVRLDNVVFDAN